MSENVTTEPDGASNSELAELTDFELDRKIVESNQMIKSAIKGRDRALDMVEKCEKSAVLSAWRVGQFLIVKKGRLEHGRWLPWLESTGIPSSSAADYMRLAREISSAGNLKSSIRATLQALPSPKSKPAPAVVEPESADASAKTIKGLESELYAEREKSASFEEQVAVMEEAVDPKTRKTIDKLNNQAELIKTLKAASADWQSKHADARRENGALKRKIKALETELGRSRPRHAA